VCAFFQNNVTVEHNGNPCKIKEIRFFAVQGPDI